MSLFGAGADDATALSVTVGVLLFAIALGAIVGPGLRARKRTDRTREGWTRRALPYLAIAVIAALGRALLSYLDAR